MKRPECASIEIGAEQLSKYLLFELATVTPCTHFEISYTYKIIFPA